MNIDFKVIGELSNVIQKTVNDHIIVRKTQILQANPEVPEPMVDDIAIMETRLAMEIANFVLDQKTVTSGIVKTLLQRSEKMPSILEKLDILWKDYEEFVDKEPDETKKKVKEIKKGV